VRCRAACRIVLTAAHGMRHVRITRHLAGPGVARLRMPRQTRRELGAGRALITVTIDGVLATRRTVTIA